jgi:DNA-binding transcriptional MerR regulator
MRAITSLGAENISIGELSRHSGVNIETIRYYERIKMLPAPSRTASGRRVYGPAEKRTLAFIRRSRDLGFTLGEIRALLALGGPERALVPTCTRSRARIWPRSVKNSPTSSSLKPSWRKRLCDAQMELPPTARCSIFWMPAGHELPTRPRANGGHRSARTMSGRQLGERRRKQSAPPQVDGWIASLRLQDAR